MANGMIPKNYDPTDGELSYDEWLQKEWEKAEEKRRMDRARYRTNMNDALGEVRQTGMYTGKDFSFSPDSPGYWQAKERYRLNSLLSDPNLSPLRRASLQRQISELGTNPNDPRNTSYRDRLGRIAQEVHALNYPS